MLCREDPEAGPTVAGLSKVKVDSVDTIFALLQVNFESIGQTEPCSLHLAEWFNLICS